MVVGMAESSKSQARMRAEADHLVAGIDAGAAQLIPGCIAQVRLHIQETRRPGSGQIASLKK